MKIVERASKFLSRTAIISNGKAYAYKDLLELSANIAGGILGSRSDLNEARIAFLVSPSYDYTAIQWAIWRSGGIAVPLCPQHPIPSMIYVIEDTGAEMIVTDDNYRDVGVELSDLSDIPLYSINSLNSAKVPNLPVINAHRRAMILFTSGTTSKPKGVVTTHRHIEAQIQTLVKAWEWDISDRILSVLPLHHVHGIINVMSCALWVGACCEFVPKFSPENVWNRIGAGELTLFMGVPTMYYQLINYWEACSAPQQKRLSAAALKLRLMVSGSAALPVSVLEKWRNITGHTLLERYGMTEIGMGLSNSYRGERRAGHVGLPFEGVELKLVDGELKTVPEGEPGEILIKGPSVFQEYWNKPVATLEAFTKDGWFKTGDMAVFNKGSYKILGRSSVDIIKSGGYKISALEIEDVLRKHPDIKDCAVVGIPNEEWGEIVGACLISHLKEIDFELLSDWLKQQLPPYKVPRKYCLKDQLPRNVLGKVTKNKVKEELALLK